MRYLTLAEALVIAEAVTGIDSAVLARVSVPTGERWVQRPRWFVDQPQAHTNVIGHTVVVIEPMACASSAPHRAEAPGFGRAMNA